MKTPLFIISGPSGAGKTTHVTQLLQELPHIHRIITYTTRVPRTGEVSGKDYVFVSHQEFATLDQTGKFIETNDYSDKRYGTHVELFDRLARGQTCLVIPDINGAQKIAAAVPGAITIWLEAPEEVLRKRLRARGTEDEKVIAVRLHTALQECAQAHEIGLYQHFIDTTLQETAYKKIKDIVTSVMR